MRDIEKKLLKTNAIWIGVGLGISFSISMLFSVFFPETGGFPYNLIAIVGVFMALGYLVQRRQLKKAGLLPSLGTGKGNYICSRCSFEYKGDVCPRCGARGGKMVFKGQ